ncbi:LysE family translocator [Luminiphilus sp.]|jgi:threonine/homoserine/homoserine lactone efflux protein|nr:LysE family translocator [Luminiphilus sp.]
MSTDLLWIFIPTIAAISLTPGMCMTLAFTVGLSQGYRHTLWMMWGELAGVATVVVTCVVLLGWIQALPKAYFNLLALIGGTYLLWVAYRLWTAPARFEQDEGQPRVTPTALLALGYTTAVMNPKGWGFMIALLPGFMSPSETLPQQLMVFLGVILPSEFLSMSLYASGGSGVRRLLSSEKHLATLNKVAAGLMVLVAMLVLIKI